MVTLSPKLGLAGAALIGILATTSCVYAQFAPDFQRPGQNAAQDPAESSAYSAALAVPDPGERISAIQQFLLAYPNSHMRQSAISQLMLAKRQVQGGENPAIERPIVAPSPPPGVAAPVAPAPVRSEEPLGPPRDSLLQQSPKPAEIRVAPHSLVIKADNSTLSQILHDISSTTGMKIDGLSKDERIFGTYGPGEAREVLLALLEGSGYNVIMIGDLAGTAPRELSLTQRVNSGPVNSAPLVRKPPQEDDDSDQDVQQAPPPEPQPVQPVQNVAPAPGQDGAQQPPRSPQEILQELQRLRQQNQNQTPQTNPQ